MEAEAAASGRERLVIAPREMNVCALFPYAQLLISSKSSVLPEFLPFGASVEIDIPFPRQCDSPLISRTYTDIAHLSSPELLTLLRSSNRLKQFLRQREEQRGRGAKLFQYPNETVTSGQRTAGLIRQYLALPAWQRTWRRVYAASRL
jgi:hypothetical protein